MGEIRNAYKILVGKPEGKRSLGRPSSRWEHNIKTDLTKTGFDGLNWVHLAQEYLRFSTTNMLQEVSTL
jgi:hypothetical protein